MPIDRLYFRKPERIFIGMKNSLIDLFFFKRFYDVKDFRNLYLFKKYEKEILNEFNSFEKEKRKYSTEELDPFEKQNVNNYYIVKAKDFPLTKLIIEMSGVVDLESAAFYVAKGPMELKAHKGDSNSVLRYHLTLKGSEETILTTEFGTYPNTTGHELLFDHSRYHKLIKTDHKERISLIVNVFRF